MVSVVVMAVATDVEAAVTETEMEELLQPLASA